MALRATEPKIVVRLFFFAFFGINPFVLMGYAWEKLDQLGSNPLRPPKQPESGQKRPFLTLKEAI